MPAKNGGELSGETIGQTCLCHNLRRAARAMTRLYDAQLAPSGLRATQFSILAAAQARGPVTLGRLAEALAQERTTLTRNLRLLEDKGFVRSEPGQDRREHSIAITDAGGAALVAARPYWRKAQETMATRLGQDPMAKILHELRQLTEAARS
ncbi:MarR family winged helix-turn-helix transcriptional regulator [Humidesulfovibrio idahonensis]